MIMKVVKKDISKILARADIIFTDSTQWLSVKKRNRGVFILFYAFIKRLMSLAVHTKIEKEGKLHCLNSVFDGN